LESKLGERREKKEDLQPGNNSRDDDLNLPFLLKFFSGSRDFFNVKTVLTKEYRLVKELF
jgi:hypothetical protein